MSDEKVNLELLGSRVLTLTAEVRDLQQRFKALEHRFTAMESRFTAMEARLGGMESRLSSLEERFAAQEDRMSAMLALIVALPSGSTGAVSDLQERHADHAALTRPDVAASSCARIKPPLVAGASG
jgi:septal ring factor EnvC (AmiA/AmiB activator)